MSATMSRPGERTGSAAQTRGWYADPLRTHDERFWDGKEWTGETRDHPVSSGHRLEQVLLVAAAVIALALALLSLGRGRETLAILAVVTVVPVAIAASVQLFRRHHGHARLTPIPVVALAWVVVVSVVTISAYREVSSYADQTCSDRLGPHGAAAGCNLAGRDLRSFELQNADLTGADLRNAKLDHVSLGGANLSGANLEGASLAGAFLSNADLDHARLDGARLEGATFDKTDLSSASMHRVNAVGAVFTSAKLSSAELVDSDLSKAQLDKADLQGATLQNTALAEATFSETNMANAVLTNVTFAGAHLEGVRNLSDAQLASALAVDPLDVAKHLADANLYLEPEAATSATVAAACAGTPVAGAGTSPSNGVFAVIVNNDLSYLPGPNHVPALRYVEAVACVGATVSDDIQVCGPYFYNDGSTAHGITRFRESAVVTIVNPANGQVITEKTFSSPAPDKCPDVTTEGTFSIGTPLDQATIQAGVNELLVGAGL